MKPIKKWEAGSSSGIRFVATREHRNNPGLILRQAIADAAAGRVALSLRKHLWFHKHAIGIPRLSGVRRADALHAWTKLAEKYPPARSALVRARNTASRAVWKAKDPWSSFHDLEAINNVLRDQANTLKLFLNLHRKSPKKAECVYSLVEPLLEQARMHDVCGEYLNPKRTFDSQRRLYRVSVRFAQDPAIGADHAHFAKKYFAEKIVRLVTLLSLNGRKTEASDIARRAKRVLNDATFKEQLAAAQRGIVG